MLAAPSLALAEKRVALVVGNSAYTGVQLPHPKNDAEDIAAALRKLGYIVFYGPDADKASMDIFTQQFVDEASDADVALFYYAGHGLQIQGLNYLVPIDADLEDPSREDLQSDLESLNHIYSGMADGNRQKIKILILDACREIPMMRAADDGGAGPVKRSLSSAPPRKGLAEVKEVEQGAGTLFVFATGPGKAAYDGPETERNSPFSGALIKHMSASADDFSSVLVNVRKDVLAATNGLQTTWESNSLLSKFYVAAREKSDVAAPPPAQTPSDPEFEVKYWQAVETSDSAAVFESYLKKYPNGKFAELARLQVDRLTAEGTQRRAAEVQKAAEEAKQRAEKQRAEAEARLAAEAKQSEELRKTREQLAAAQREREEALKQAEAALRAKQESEKAVEAKRAEDARKITEAQAAAEAERIAAARKAEEDKRKAELAKAEEERKAKEAQAAAQTAARKAEEDKRKAELAKAEEERKSKEAQAAAQTAARKAEEDKRKAELAKAEEERKAREALAAAEADRLAVIQKAEQEKREAQEALEAAEAQRQLALKTAEDARRSIEQASKAAAAVAQQTKVAALTALTPATAPAADSVDRARLARDLKMELKRVGCYAGPADGPWDPAAKTALADFVKRTKTTLPTTDEPTEIALKIVFSQGKRVCRPSCGDDEVDRGDKCVQRASLNPVRKAQPAAVQRERERAPVAAARPAAHPPRAREPSGASDFLRGSR